MLQGVPPYMSVRMSTPCPWSRCSRELATFVRAYADIAQDLTEAVELSPLVDGMLELLKVSISKSVVLKRYLRENLPAAWGNASQIRQVVMNLVINASEAIGDKEGVITVTTTQVTGGRELAPDNAIELTPGDYVKLEVSDTGSGMRVPSWPSGPTATRNSTAPST